MMNDDFSDEEEPLLTQESALFSMKSISSQESKKAEVEEQKRESKYINCLCIGSSAGIVECLISKFDALADQRCSGMCPVMIEAILYLNLAGNVRFSNVEKMVELTTRVCRPDMSPTCWLTCR
jgi:hypothetical protein